MIITGKDENRDIIDHLLVVNGARRMVHDTFEGFLLELRSGEFSACVGDEVRFVSFK